MATLSRDAALALVVIALARGERRYFHLGLVGYYIEGMPYVADALAMGPETTPNVRATEDGLVCDTFFPPALLEAAIVRSNTVMHSETGVDLVRVTLEVKRQDVWVVAEFVDGIQQNLFFDPETLLERKLSFARELGAWRRVGEPGFH